jgi:hypothetical protein
VWQKKTISGATGKAVRLAGVGDKRVIENEHWLTKDLIIHGDGFIPLQAERK